MNTAETNTGEASRSSLPAAVQRAVHAARDKKALDVQVLDLRPVDGFTDFFVICSGKNLRQVQAIADAENSTMTIEKKVLKTGREIWTLKGAS